MIARGGQVRMLNEKQTVRVKKGISRFPTVLVENVMNS